MAHIPDKYTQTEPVYLWKNRDSDTDGSRVSPCYMSLFGWGIT